MMLAPKSAFVLQYFKSMYQFIASCNEVWEEIGNVSKSVGFVYFVRSNGQDPQAPRLSPSSCA